MCNIAHVLACLAFASIGTGKLQSLSSLAEVLFALNPSAAFNPLSPGLSSSVGKCIPTCLHMDPPGWQSPVMKVLQIKKPTSSSPGTANFPFGASTSVAAKSLLSFERQGHVTLRRVLPAARIHDALHELDAGYQASLVEVYRQKVRVIMGEKALAATEAKAAEKGSASLLSALRQQVAQLPEGSVPFLQAFNLWRKSPAVAALASSPELAGVASQLLGVDRVRLYQDSLFVKRPGDGETHWHSDLAMSPLDTNDFVTVWLPLQPVPPEAKGGSGLVFASGSHRDVALHFWHGHPRHDADCSGRGYVESTLDATGLKVGDSTWHHGWTLHCASPNFLESPRRALAISYFADGAKRLDSPRRKPHSEDTESYSDWLPDVSPGRAARHSLLPLVWDSSKGGAIPISVKETQPRPVRAGARKQLPSAKEDLTLKPKPKSKSKVKLKIKQRPPQKRA